MPLTRFGLTLFSGSIPGSVREIEGLQCIYAPPGQDALRYYVSMVRMGFY